MRAKPDAGEVDISNPEEALSVIPPNIPAPETVIVYTIPGEPYTVELVEEMVFVDVVITGPYQPTGAFHFFIPK